MSTVGSFNPDRRYPLRNLGIVHGGYLRGFVIATTNPSPTDGSPIGSTCWVLERTPGQAFVFAPTDSSILAVGFPKATDALSFAELRAPNRDRTGTPVTTAWGLQERLVYRIGDEAATTKALGKLAGKSGTYLEIADRRGGRAGVILEVDLGPWYVVLFDDAGFARDDGWQVRLMAGYPPKLTPAQFQSAVKAVVDELGGASVGYRLVPDGPQGLDDEPADDASGDEPEGTFGAAEAVVGPHVALHEYDVVSGNDKIAKNSLAIASSNPDELGKIVGEVHYVLLRTYVPPPTGPALFAYDATTTTKADWLKEWKRKEKDQEGVGKPEFYSYHAGLVRRINPPVANETWKTVSDQFSDFPIGTVHHDGALEIRQVHQGYVLVKLGNDIVGTIISFGTNPYVEVWTLLQGKSFPRTGRLQIVAAANSEVKGDKELNEALADTRKLASPFGKDPTRYVMMLTGRDDIP